MSKDFSGLEKSRQGSGHNKYGRIKGTEGENMQQALMLMQQGNYKDAELIYKGLIERGSDNYIVFENLAKICYMDNRIREMITLLKQALKLNPDYPEGLSNLGLALQKQGDLQAAIQLYEKALSIKPDFLDSLRKLASALKEQGELQKAIDCYKKALAMEPNSPGVLINLGSTLQEQGKLQEATDYYKKALTIEPNSLGALINLGGALKEQGELQEAIDYLKKALAMEPNSPGVLINLGSALQGQEKLQEAIDFYHKALAIKPNSLAALINLGSALQGQKKLQEAVDFCHKALAIEPNSLAALINLGSALQGQEKLQEAIGFYHKALAIEPNSQAALLNLGSVLVKKRELQKGIDYYKKVLAINPNSLTALIKLSGALQDQGKLEEAINCSRKALAIEPNSPRALVSLGGALMKKGEFQESIDYSRKALAIKTNSRGAMINLGAALAGLGELQECIIMYRKVISLSEDGSEDQLSAHWNLALALLSSGDYENGWKEYEWRFRHKVKLHAHPLQLKKWDGYSNCSGDKLILITEQGLGDTLQFMRYVPCLRKKGMTIALCAQTKLHGLIQASGIATEVYSHQDVHKLTTGEWLPLLSLPGYFNVGPNKPIINEPYIKVPEENILYWRQKLSAQKRPIIGINWQGNLNTEVSVLSGRSFPLKTFARISENIDASFLSLQKGSGSEQLTDCKFLDRFVDCQEEINLTWDFVDNAAIMMNCDLIITTDTCVAHLAGGLGRPTWLLLHKAPDWRWGMEGDTTFWYPSMRLFRQRERRNWQEVMDRVAVALQRFFNWPESPIMAKTPSPRNVSSLMAPIAFAELIDKMTILEIKSEKFRGDRKRNVDHELNLLKQILRQSGVELLSEHYQQLKAINESLWQIEEDIRSHETDQEFGEAFIHLARSVYLQNDKRAAVKKMINDYYGSEIIEEKSYQSSHHQLDAG